ncbi:MAG: pyruvate ferredoxin oxidoreductase [candidate division Zixibacteria bacterium]|nr:pyruvate ferredoxin oxidoreductase [candidate division Zixibacteria bacterium]MDH3938175.1 pyruvate ferredoxin oxidoreductase [candidate division Zixibacteria bacterium]MDH4034672.1 pyruvate ferredoxin oxidoreductase [candidate division Zixibacteria bacterium]
MKQVMSGNEAVSKAVKLSRVQVISAYPITPQTTISEKLSEICGSGELDARFVKVESEHSAMATLIGAASTGVRSFTATSAQGLALMHELLFWASGARLPIVMVDVNRAMAAPWTIWCDQTDSVAQRDTGWMQFYCWSNQEILDTVICSFKIAEQLLVPTMICFDGFFISHTHEAVDLPSQKLVDSFLPPRRAEYRLDTDEPRTFSGGTMPNMFMEFRHKLHSAFERAQTVIDETYAQFEGSFGRSYQAVEPYFTEEAESTLIVTGSAASTAFHTVRKLRERGRKVGLLRLRQLRPFPAEALCAQMKNDSAIAVLDRNLSPGTGGVFAQEVRAALSRNDVGKQVHEFVAGLGGRDITVSDIERIFDDLENNSANSTDINWVGLNQ